MSKIHAPIPKCGLGDHPLNRWGILDYTEDGTRTAICMNCKHQKDFPSGRLQTKGEMNEKAWWNQ